MALFSLNSEGLPLADELVRFARRDGQHDEIERADALHGEDVEGADGDAILFAVAAVAVDYGENGAGFRLALVGESRHKD